MVSQCLLKIFSRQNLDIAYHRGFIQTSIKICLYFRHEETTQFAVHISCAVDLTVQ